MTETEAKALHWLSQTTGFEEADIRYSCNSSPDFQLPDGRGFEIKCKHQQSRSITIYEAQWKKLLKHPDCQIVIWGDSTEPLACIPMSELPYQARRWHEWHIRFWSFTDPTWPTRLKAFKRANPHMSDASIAGTFHRSVVDVRRVLRQIPHV
uniref:Uncharacterized protein n=1 Tax=viral metagenome TaxID=1070528 RepID=A0A6M3Y3W4_9ZZZZ